jgi:hypothetical protein
MSGLETIKEEFDIQDDVIEAEDAEALEPEEVEQEEREVDPEVERATADGWMPKEDWVAKGKDPDDWVSHRKFNERGEMMGKIKELDSKLKNKATEFEDRISSINKIHKMQLNEAIKRAEQARDEAIEIGDKEAAVNAMQNINDLNDEVKTIDGKPKIDTSSDQTVLDKFNSDNPWIVGSDPKAAYAKAQFSMYQSGGKSVQESIDAMMVDVSKHFPEVNPNRDQPARVESNRSRPGKRAVRKLTMSDVSSEEKKMRSLFDSDEKFLKAIQDTRA